MKRTGLLPDHSCPRCSGDGSPPAATAAGVGSFLGVVAVVLAAVGETTPGLSLTVLGGLAALVGLSILMPHLPESLAALKQGNAAGAVPFGVVGAAGLQGVALVALVFELAVTAGVPLPSNAGLSAVFEEAVLRSVGGWARGALPALLVVGSTAVSGAIVGGSVVAGLAYTRGMSAESFLGLGRLGSWFMATAALGLGILVGAAVLYATPQTETVANGVVGALTLFLALAAVGDIWMLVGMLRLVWSGALADSWVPEEEQARSRDTEPHSGDLNPPDRHSRAGPT